MLCFAFAIACTDTMASAPYESSSIPNGAADGSGVIRRVDVEYMPASSNQFTIARWSWKSGEPI